MIIKKWSFDENGGCSVGGWGGINNTGIDWYNV